MRMYFYIILFTSIIQPIQPIYFIYLDNFLWCIIIIKWKIKEFIVKVKLVNTTLVFVYIHTNTKCGKPCVLYKRTAS